MFHALVWGSQYPNWLSNLSVADTKTAITNWFDAVAKHYPDLQMIEVVNEAIRVGENQYHSGYSNTKIIQALGGDNNGDYAFVTTAFKMARERWPKAILIYNDYNTIQFHKDEGIDLIQKLKKNGAPVNAYGLQGKDLMAQEGNCLNIKTLESTIDEIWNKTQLPIFITEYEIGTDNDNVQEKCYEEQISYFMNNEHIAGITIWGYIYGATETTNGNSGIIKNGVDRLAMAWLKGYLPENKGANTTGLWDPDGPEENSSSSAEVNSNTSSATGAESSSTVTNSSSSAAGDESSSSSIVDKSSASTDGKSSTSVKDTPVSSSSSSTTADSSSASDKQPNVDVQSSSSSAPTVVWNNRLRFGGANLATYDVYDLKGQKLVRFVAHNMEEVTQMWNNWSANASKVQGIVLIRNRLSGETVQIRSVR